MRAHSQRRPPDPRLAGILVRRPRAHNHERTYLHRPPKCCVNKGHHLPAFAESIYEGFAIAPSVSRRRWSRWAEALAFSTFHARKGLRAQTISAAHLPRRSWPSLNLRLMGSLMSAGQHLGRHLAHTAALISCLGHCSTRIGCGRWAGIVVDDHRFETFARTIGAFRAPKHI